MPALLLAGAGNRTQVAAYSRRETRVDEDRMLKSEGTPAVSSSCSELAEKGISWLDSLAIDSSLATLAVVVVVVMRDAQPRPLRRRREYGDGRFEEAKRCPVNQQKSVEACDRLARGRRHETLKR